ncbi:Uncharacterized protein conserved in bacteria, prophage-related [Burkholderia pseudomallei]|uniref:helix-turn-helix domain-containing protein n=1 Tax=Burkholderia pseudomallei TaxID=28450 RepID=UPI0005E4C3DE|nr:helix-turn-helix domain-containing protein [Burkholderia pseudomallei]MBF3650483.1 hypothetical protein [Burkholderia pseudomallei]CAJ2721782.1 Uncharacterized protein conserved in bacteria, prophage-related [Burkholderia pseudomallei]CAJ2903216.1 Uncharacterized protein conserved in bacteria, prophage-related [Burkholderia pseudomallei]CAJ3001807.1 Uncharacterized protein conserved in bacteria, prophage-related [Burkholderia pseudomallei]CAJ5441258.1 Uncharacterized protein conserved in ba
MNPTKSPPRNEALERAIASFKSLSDMARQLDLSGYQVIQQWRASGRVPPQHCTKLARLTGESRDDLVGFPPLDANPESEDDVQPVTGGTVG